jgi:hypothetical protein
VSDIDTAAADSLKALDLEWPIREADMGSTCCWLDPVANDRRVFTQPRPDPDTSRL